MQIFSSAGSTPPVFLAATRGYHMVVEVFKRFFDTNFLIENKFQQTILHMVLKAGYNNKVSNNNNKNHNNNDEDNNKDNKDDNNNNNNSINNNNNNNNISFITDPILTNEVWKGSNPIYLGALVNFYQNSILIRIAVP